MITRANATHIPLKDESVHCIITSPPYWSLRKYDIPDLIWDGEDKCEHYFQEYVRPDGGGYPTESAQVGNTKNDLQRVYGYKAGFCGRCGAWRGQLGLEPTIDLYLKHLLQIMDECKRVLRDDGTMWVNLGDSYCNDRLTYKMDGDFSGTDGLYQRKTDAIGGLLPKRSGQGIPTKSLCLIPERFAIEMVNRGWILRNKIIWKKSNCMPSSAKDRFTVDFEDVFFFTKSNDTQYWTNERTGKLVSKQPLGTKGIEGEDWEWRECPSCKKDIVGTSPDKKIIYHKSPVFEGCKKCKGTGQMKYSFWSGHDYWFEQQYDDLSPLTIADKRNDTGRHTQGKNYSKYFEGDESPDKPSWYRGKVFVNPSQGRNRRCVWTISTQPYPESHFATFPEALVEPMIRAGCPQFVCKKCRKGREKIIKAEGGTIGRSWHDHKEDLKQGQRADNEAKGGHGYKKIDKGLTDCGCNAGFEGGVCLDPFAGSGTVLRVAEQLNRKAIGLDLGYQPLSVKRLQNVQKELSL